jgi:hypothetical protein
MDCWHRSIDRAGTEAEVVKSAADYLALWSPRELAPLTLGWRELRLRSGADIERMKRMLIDDLAVDVSAEPDTAHLRDLGDYFWHAASRVGQIRGTA